MAKKLMLLGMAVVAFAALALPAVASAAPALTEPAGTLVPKGATIVGTSTNSTTVTSAGTLTCAKVTVTGEVTENTGSSVKGVAKGEGKTEGCKLGSSSLTITDPTLLAISSNTPGKGVVSLTFIADLFGIPCHFVGNNLPFTYTSGSDSMSIAGTLTGTSGFPCPSSGSFSGTYTLETSNGTPLILD